MPGYVGNYSWRRVGSGRQIIKIAFLFQTPVRKKGMTGRADIPGHLDSSSYLGKRIVMIRTDAGNNKAAAAVCLEILHQRSPTWLRKGGRI